MSKFVTWLKSFLFFIYKSNTYFSSFELMSSQTVSEMVPWCQTQRLFCWMLTHREQATHIYMDKIIHHWFRWWLFSAEPLSESVLTDYQLDPKEQTSVKLGTKCSQENEFENVVCTILAIFLGLNLLVAWIWSVVVLCHTVILWWNIANVMQQMHVQNNIKNWFPEIYIKNNFE